MATNILMGEYEIYCDKNKEEWLLIDKLGPGEKRFNTLTDLLDYIGRDIGLVDIE